MIYYARREALEMVLKVKEYRYVRHIGRYGCTSCYLVESLKWHTVFVCKQALMTDETMCFGVPCEVNCLRRLSSENVIRMYDCHVEGMYFYVFLEYCQKGTLDRYLRRNGQLRGIQLLGVMKTLLSVVEFLHSQRIAHRDIKPTNLFLAQDGRLKVADFGLSRIYRDDKPIWDRVGTWAYMSPEMWGNDSYDPFKADIWALGVTFFVMSTGLELWPPTESCRLQNFICKGVSDEAVARLPENVKEIIMRMLTRDPNKRPTAKELLEDEIFQNVKVTDGILKQRPRMPLTFASPGDVKFRSSRNRKLWPPKPRR